MIPENHEKQNQGHTYRCGVIPPQLYRKGTDDAAAAQNYQQVKQVGTNDIAHRNLIASGQRP